MRRALRCLVLVAMVGAVVGGTAGSGTAGSPSQPRWVRHVLNYPGGISNGVRARLAADDVKTSTKLVRSAAALPGALENVQANADCDPALPQNETSVAFNVSDHLNAVAAANDYCGDGFWIGHTTNGGHSWISEFKDPKTSTTGERCFGSDPSVVYSAKDGVFYLSTLCYFSTSPISEVQVWASDDGGATWTASTKAAIAITNRSGDGSIDGSVFYDKELLAVDNNVDSALYGRLYVTFIKFHMVLPSGRSDYCPVQVAYTNSIPTADPSTSTWAHAAVVPDAPGSNGVGGGANQWALPVVDDTGALNVSYISEDCNTSYDRALYFKRSIDGGQTFGARVRIDKPGQFRDNPNYQDLLPAKKARIPISPSMVFDPTRGTLLYAYQNNLHRDLTGADISLQTSADFGQSWSDARTLSVTASGSAAPRDQFFPWLAVDESGNAHAIWYDNRKDLADKRIRTFQALSTDGAATWEFADISTAAWNPDKGFFSCGCFIGDYNALAASDQVVYPVWTDGRDSAGPPLGETDIFTNVEVTP
ncbi:MAG TPA: sialidase family protein [Actinomycetota bacterium]